MQESANLVSAGDNAENSFSAAERVSFDAAGRAAMAAVPVRSSTLASLRRSGSTAAAWLAGRPWPLLIGFSVVLNVVVSLNSNYTWHYVVTGSKFLFTGSGLHLYAVHPELQMGPLTFVVTAPMVLLLPIGVAHALIIAGMATVGLTVLRLVQRLIPADRPVPPLTFLAVGVLFTAVWAELSARWGHPDDAGALLLMVVALALLQEQRTALMALSLAAAVDFKPWAVAAVPLLFAAHRSTWLRSAMIIGAGIAAVWLPFFLADRHALRALRFSIPNVADSSLRILGVHDGFTPPWLRTVQLGLAALLAILLALRGKSASVILAVIAIRLLFDPATKGYYTSGLLVGTALIDLAELGKRAWLTLAATLFLFLPNYLLGSYPMTRGVMRAAVLLTIIVYLLIRSFSRVRGSAHFPQ